MISMPKKNSASALRDATWSADEAASAIDEIVSDALAHLDAERLWPAHPSMTACRTETPVSTSVRPA
jgi:hypothetical protein